MPYLDHAATTPMLPQAVAAVTAAMASVGGANASSVHRAGRRARALVEESRETVAALLGADPLEVVFTSGGTESINLALKGIYWARRAEGPSRVRVITSAVEHHAVLDAVHWIESHEGATVTVLPVDAEGRVDPDALDTALHSDGGPDTVALVSVMWANNEVGTLQPVRELAELCARHQVPFHTDAVQAVGQVSVDFGSAQPGSARPLTAVSLSARKLGGPGGAGALLLRRGIPCVPLLHGGGHENGLRSGSLDAAGAAGLAAALSVRVAQLEAAAARVAALRAKLRDAVRAAVPDVEVNGPDAPDGRLPGHLHVTVPGCDGDLLLMLLDAAGVECATGSACSSGVPEPSHVLIAMGRDPLRARSSLRFSLGHTSTEGDVEAVRAALPEAVARARAATAAAPTSARAPHAPTPAVAPERSSPREVMS